MARRGPDQDDKDQKEIDAALSGPNETDPIPEMGGRTAEEIRISETPLNLDDMNNPNLAAAIDSGDLARVSSFISSSSRGELTEAQVIALRRTREEAEKDAYQERVSEEQAAALREEEKEGRPDEEWIMGAAHAPYYENAGLTLEAQTADKFGGKTDAEGNYHDRFGGVYDTTSYLSADKTARTYASGMRLDRRSGKVFDRHGQEREFSEEYKTVEEKEALLKTETEILQHDNPRHNWRVDREKANKVRGGGLSEDAPELSEEQMEVAQDIQRERYLHGRRRDANLTPEELQAARERRMERLANMTPEERQAARERREEHRSRRAHSQPGETAPTDGASEAPLSRFTTFGASAAPVAPVAETVPAETAPEKAEPEASAVQDPAPPAPRAAPAPRTFAPAPPKPF